MITCPNCNNQLPDETKFCENCGTMVVETIFCQNCGQQASTEFAFCQNCGSPLSEEKPATQESKRKFTLPFTISKKIITIAASAIAAVLVVVIVLSLVLGSGSPNYAFYMKDDEICAAKLSGNKIFEITENLYEDSYDGYVYAYVSKDGKRIFYPDRYEDGEFTLYYRELGKSNKEPVKIDSGLTESSFYINDAGTRVVYEKGDSLYIHNLKERQKIDGDVLNYWSSDDLKSFVILDGDGKLYRKDGNKEKVGIAKDVDRLMGATDNLDTIYYIKDDDKLYKQTGSKGGTKISSDVEDVLMICDSGEMYYVKSDSKEVSLLDYVIDDMKEEDADIVDYDDLEYPSHSDYDSYEEYDAAYEEYEEARDLAYDKEERDELREDLADEKMEISTYSLCYYDGKKETVLTENFDYSSYDYECSVDAATILYSTCETKDIEKVKLSEIEYYWDVEDLIEDAQSDSKKYCLAVGGKVSEIEQSEADNFDLSDDGKTIYFIADASEKTDCGDLYCIKVSGGKAGKSKKCDEDVYSGWFAENDKYIYYKDVRDKDDGLQGDLYIDNKEIDTDVKVGSTTYDEESGQLLYFTDWDEGDECGTLKVYKSGKPKIVSDEAHSCEFSPKGDILFIYDYDTDDCEGELYVYKGRKPKMIDDDVSGFASVYYIED